MRVSLFARVSCRGALDGVDFSPLLVHSRELLRRARGRRLLSRVRVSSGSLARVVKAHVRVESFPCLYHPRVLAHEGGDSFSRVFCISRVGYEGAR